MGTTPASKLRIQSTITREANYRKRWMPEASHLALAAGAQAMADPDRVSGHREPQNHPMFFLAYFPQNRHGT